MSTFFQQIRAFAGDESGGQGIEYALIAALVGLAFAGGATVLGTGLNSMFTDVGKYIDAVPVPTPPAPPA